MRHTFYGDNLEEAINEVNLERQPLIENLLYEKSAIMLYADDGVGKSVLALQMCMQATTKESVCFGEFQVARDCNVLYFQMERHPDESFERMKYLKNVIPFEKSRFSLSVALQGTNLQDRDSRVEAIKKVGDIKDEIGYMPDIVAFDPIYTLASSGLETAEACNAITSFFRIVQLYLNCTILATSHTNRGIRDLDNPNKRIGKDMYGNRFLSAFFTGSYHINPKSDGAGSSWHLNKNSQKNLEPKFELFYDPSNYLSMTRPDNKFTKKDRLNNFLAACKSTNKEFSFEEMQAISGLSDSSLRGHLSGYLREKLVHSSKLSYGKVLYRFLG